LTPKRTLKVVPTVALSAGSKMLTDCAGADDGVAQPIKLIARAVNVQRIEKRMLNVDMARIFQNMRA
jgi:hypothetical protein